MSWVDPDAVARAWHWSDSAPVRHVQVDDEDLPDPLIACGVWVSATISVPGRGTRTLSCDDRGCYLAFDPHSPRGRLYLVLTPSVRAAVRGEFWTPGARTMSLSTLARSVGGSQQGGYPPIQAQTVGRLSTIEYECRKYADGAENGARFFHDHDPTLPWLAVSEDGRLWYIGGSYTALPTEGITG